MERMSEGELGLVTVLETWDPALLAVVKSVLQGSAIDYVVEGEEAMSLLPVGEMLGPFTRRGLAVRVKVRPEDAGAARELLDGSVAD